jgi:hypothetical protein
VNIDDWVDETVKVEVVRREYEGEPERIKGTLKSVDERGVLLSTSESWGGTGVRERTLFFPWHRIGQILVSEATHLEAAG